MCVEEWVDPLTVAKYESTPAPRGSPAALRRKEVRRDDAGHHQPAQLREKESRIARPRLEQEEKKLPGFLQDIVDVLSVLRFGSNQFLDYIQTEDFSKEFNEGTKYTALIPLDEAFQRWYPIDWGFNPFEVDSFARQTLLDHFLVGQVDQTDVEDGAEFRTLGGRKVTFTRKTAGDNAPGKANLRWAQINCTSCT